MLRETPNTESVIVEYGFLDNVRDAAKLKANYKNYAEAVVRAVLEYKGLPYSLQNEGNTYVVKSGDTLWTIAKNNGLTVNELKELNGLTNNSLSIGQILKLTSGEDILPDNGDISGGVYYSVVAGDTLYSIAGKYGLTVDELKSLNNLTSNTLSIGQQLLIQNNQYNKSNITYTVVAGDSLYKIANRYGTTVDAIKKTNNLTSNLLSIGQTLTIPDVIEIEDDYETYTVKSGDTLYGIAMSYGTTVDKIKVLNNLTSNTLSIGQKLLIP